MKLAIDERVKHRLVGLAVILSVAAILLPAILKKSSQPFDAMSRVAVRLPARPAMPSVSVTDETKLFKNIKVAKVTLPTPTPMDDAQVSASVKVASLKSPNLPLKEESLKLEKPITSVLPTPPQVVIKAAPSPQPLAQISKPRKPAMTQVISKRAQVEISRRHTAFSTPPAGFAVQVANFSSVENARTLMNKLQSNGYHAQLSKLVSRHGVSYKVMVGNAAKREDIVRLQRQLYSKMQLHGFVVTVNVG